MNETKINTHSEFPFHVQLGTMHFLVKELPFLDAVVCTFNTMHKSGYRSQAFAR